MTTFSVVQEGPVNALALNKENTQVAIGGRNVFKVYAIEEDRFREVCNLRASKHLNLGFSCNDVSWSWTDEHYLATAATNGHVCVWNLTKMGKAVQEQDYQEHKRTVNKVNFHISEPYRLISGSQDGTMRYFDIRVKNAVAIFYSNTESVRDVQFSPHNPFTFSAVSENGSVQLWDVRRSDKCQQQYTAHSGPIFACDWHPEQSWLATASRDKTIKVWDLTTKPTLEYTIHTIASIGHVKWRPQTKYHIASCALVVDCSINIWDVRRPYIPFAAFNEHKDIASGVAWKGDPHIFLSSGRDCTLYQHTFNQASHPASKANPQSISLNNKGEVLYAYKVNVNNNAIVKAAVGLIRDRKSSNTQPVDHFHLASSLMHQFTLTGKEDSCNFIKIAENYLLSGRSLSEMCDHNSAVAKQYGNSQVSVFWKIIKTMYGEEYLQNTPANSKPREDNKMAVSAIMDHQNDDQRSRGGCETPVAQFSDEAENEDQVDHIAIYSNGFPTYLNFRTCLPKGDFVFGENELDMDLGFRSYGNPQHDTAPSSLGALQDWSLPHEAFNIRHEIRDRSPPPEQYPNNHSPDLNHDDAAQISAGEDQAASLLSVSNHLKIIPWDPSRIVLESLKHHAELGDVQTAASVLVVLGEHRKSLVGLDETMQEHWLLGYIELLSRFEMWNVTTRVLKLSWLPHLEQMNHQSTRFVTNCGKCEKILQRVGWLCDRCHTSRYGNCGVCHQVVKGLYAWCQGCGHGGHLAHMRLWMSANKTCPTGCGHLCEFR